ncbi:MAG: PAS domain-containing protein, partial [Chlamydiota bacterium]|nr:PAS domain-containing protein [Chlamydiota bacterium]
MAKKTDESTKSNQDIDQLHQEIAALKMKLGHCDRLFKLSRDLLAMISSDGKIISFNHAWTQVLGYSLEALSGFSCVEVVHPDDKKKLIEQFAFVLTSPDRISDFDIRFRAKDGHYKWLSWHIAGRLDQDCVYAVIRDETASKKEDMEKEVSNMTDPLTGLYNRTGFLSHASGYLRFAVRKKTELLLFLVHMGGLKKINDV